MYIDLRSLHGTERLTTGPELAKELEQILNRDAQFDVGALSRETEGNRIQVVSFRDGNDTLSLTMQRTQLKSGTWVWLFAPDSATIIPRIARLTSASPIEKYLPAPLVTITLFGAAIWRWIALLVLVLFAFAFSRLFCSGILWIGEIAARRWTGGVDRSVLNSLIGPLRLFLVVGAFHLGIAWIEPPALVRFYIDRLLALAFFGGITWLGAVIVDLVAHRLRVVLQAKHTTWSYSVLPLGSRIVKLTILVLAITSLLSAWGYNTTTILAGLGVGGLAIALAAQKTVENLFGGVSVISDRPVVVGDSCRFGDRTGVIEDIGLRSTRIRTPDRTLVSVPNAQFSSMTLENFSRRDKMWLRFVLNLRRDTTPDQVRAVLSSIGRILIGDEKVETGAVPVRFVGVGTYSLDIEVDVYILTREGTEFFRTQQDLLLRILDAVKAAGTALAIPTQASVPYQIQASPAPLEIAKAEIANPEIAKR
jgi:MscS family membrane protein